MALWRLESDTTGESDFDDGLKFSPGEEGFTREIALEHFGVNEFYYLGTPNHERAALDEVQPEGEE